MLVFTPLLRAQNCMVSTVYESERVPSIQVPSPDSALGIALEAVAEPALQQGRQQRYTGCWQTCG